MNGKLSIEVYHTEEGLHTEITGRLENADHFDKCMLLMEFAQSLDLERADFFALMMTYDDFVKKGKRTKIVIPEEK